MSTPAPALRVGERTRRLGEPRTIAVLGISLGILAFWLALPPWTLRDLAFPVAAGFLGAGAGIAALARGERRLGTIAIVISVLGFNLIGDGLREALDPKLRGRG